MRFIERVGSQELVQFNERDIAGLIRCQPFEEAIVIPTAERRATFTMATAFLVRLAAMWSTA